MIFTIFLYFVQPAHEAFTPTEQQQATQNVTLAADWWHARRGDVFSIQVKEVVNPAFDPFVDWSQLQPIPDEHTIVVFAVDNSQSGRNLEYGTQQALGYGTWHTVYMLNTGGPWLPAHEIGHAIYLLPDLSGEMIDIMNPYTARTAYDRNLIGCASLATLGSPCGRTYLPIIAH